MDINKTKRMQGREIPLTWPDMMIQNNERISSSMMSRMAAGESFQESGPKKVENI